jgi:hypothetical protein
MIAPADEEHAIFQIDGDARDVTMLESRRQLLPSLDDLVFQ